MKVLGLPGGPETSWRRLGAPWERLGAIWGPLGRVLGVPWARLGALGPSWKDLGGILEGIWAGPGEV